LSVFRPIPPTSAHPTKAHLPPARRRRVRPRGRYGCQRCTRYCLTNQRLILETGTVFRRIFRETDPAKADRETTLQDLLSGQFNDPLRVIAFNTREGWSRDVSHEIAVELQRRADIERRELGGTIAEFVDAHTSWGGSCP